jgi:septum formation protein
VTATSGEGLFRTIEPLILASASPRRQELLRSFGIGFEVVASNLAEDPDPACGPHQLVERWARQKAETVAANYPESYVLGADTIVVLEGEIFGKPSGAGDAESMLGRLSGRTHEVITGICLTRSRRYCLQTRTVTTLVRFRALGMREIRAYVATLEPLDKAGAYGIQGLGGWLVEAIEGSYTNVVGLPIGETLEMLLANGVIDYREQG